MRCAVYSRKSKATDKGESIEAQIDMCKSELTRYHQIDPGDIDVYIDEGFSGKNTSRPQFRLMMQKVRAREYKFVVSYKLDRISRNVCDFADVYTVMQKAGCDYISVDEKFDTSTPIGRAMMFIASVFAQMERETIAQRVSDNMLFLAHTGHWLGGKTPAGYACKRIHADPALGIAKSYSILTEDEETLPVVRMIYEEYQRTGSIGAVRKYLNRNHMSLNGNERISDYSIRSILTNPVYCAADADAYQYFRENGCSIGGTQGDFDGSFGVIAYNRHLFGDQGISVRPIEEWVVARSFHKPILSGKEWIAIREAIIANGKLHPRVQGKLNDVALLSGLLYCKKCGKRMHVQPQNSGRGKTDTGRFTYLCQTRKNFGPQACDMKSIAGKTLDAELLAQLRTYQNPDSDLGTRVKRLNVLCKEKKEKEALAEDIRRTIQKKRNQLSKIVDQMIENDFEGEVMASLKEKSSLIGNEIRELEAECARLESDGSREMDAIEYLHRALSDVASSTDETSIQVLRNLVQRAVKRVEWDGETIRVFLPGE